MTKNTQDNLDLQSVLNSVNQHMAAWQQQTEARLQEQESRMFATEQAVAKAVE